MTCGKEEDITVCKDVTLRRTYRLNTGIVGYAAITGITRSAPAIVTALSHGLKTGWSVAMQSVLGMTQINALNDPPRSSDEKTITVTGLNTLELDGVNSLGFSAYISGGTLRYKKPFNLVGSSASFKIFNRDGGTLLTTWDVSGGQLTIDSAADKIELTVPVAQITALTWKIGWYEFLLTDAVSVTWDVAEGNITIED